MVNSDVFTTIPDNVDPKKCIATHGQKFHADESLSVSLLKVLPDYKKYTIIRTREPEIIDKCGIVVDVGKVYDPIKMRFDHHQRDFNETFSNEFTTKLSSAGLMYNNFINRFKHFGHRIVQTIMNREIKDNDPDTKLVCDRVYKIFIEQIDACDNGIDISESPRFQVSSSISQRVAKLNASPRIL